VNTFGAVNSKVVLSADAIDFGGGILTLSLKMRPLHGISNKSALTAFRLRQEIQQRAWQKRFAGYRVNCESIPRLPARFVRFVINDPRHIPYLLVWQWRDDPEIKEAAMVRWRPPDDWIELKRSDQSGQHIRLHHSPLPRRGGTALLLFCPDCGIPRRHLYGWSVIAGRLLQSSWRCRACAGLRYQSEGTYISVRWRFWGSGFPRPEPWDPFLLSNLEQASILTE